MKLKKKTIAYFSILVLALTIIYCTEKEPERNNNIPNPAAVYCEKLAYKYTVESENGQAGYCIFPNGEKCEEWSFFAGKCGQNWSYCEKHGGKIETTTEGCSFSTECAVCVLPTGERCYEWDYFNGECP